MKKLIALILSLIFVLSLVGCSSKQNIPILADVSQMGYKEVNEVLSGRTINELRDAWGTPIDSDENGDTWQVDDSMIITVKYDENTNSGYVESCELVCGTPLAPIESLASDEIISYNGKEYKKSELCNATLHWLELSEQERLLSSYFPPEFMFFEEIWGITLTAENITPTSATIKCTQSGGKPTGELQTGSWYILEAWTQENGWKEMPYVIDSEIGWTEEAWMIPMGNSCEWEVNWEWLYGELPTGKYRIGKEIMDFRATGDYDEAVYFVEFNIE